MTVIVGLESKNVKRLRAVSIEPAPGGGLVIIGGENAQGKTCVLDSIEYAMAGKRSLPKVPLRRGADYGKTTLRLSNGLKVTRSYTEDGGGTFTVEGEGDAVFRSPQKILDGFYEALSFDPLAFDSMKPAERAELMAKLVGLDLVQLDGQRLKIFQARAAVNREVRQLEGALSQMAAHDKDVPVEEISIAELAAKLEEADASVAAASVAESEVLRLDREIDEHERSIDRLRETKKTAQQRHEVNMTAWSEEIGANEGVQADLRAAIPEQQEIAQTITPMREKQEGIRVELREAEGTNEKVRANAARTERAGSIQAAQAKAAGLTEDLGNFDAEKAATIAQAGLPVEELSFGDGDVLYNGLPWDQASLRERIVASVGMGFALNPDFKVLLVRDGSCLDDEGMALCAQLADEHEGQLWIERVGDRDEAAIVIEDGRVRGADVETTPDEDAGDASDSADGEPNVPDSPASDPPPAGDEEQGDLAIEEAMKE
ncbi:MAG: AAA family ATPase [Gemmatimonadota bacterium]